MRRRLLPVSIILLTLILTLAATATAQADGTTRAEPERAAPPAPTVTRDEPAPAAPPAPSVTRAEPAPASAPDASEHLAEATAGPILASAQVTRAEPAPATPPSSPLPSPAADEPAGGSSFLADLQDAVIGGSVSFNLRLRAEIADIDGLGKSQAYTERLRLGYGTKPLYGFKAYVEFEDTRAADYDLYNAAGLNSEPDKTVIADPENTELNQLFAQYEHEYFLAKAGRQRMILDNARFVGNVGWRQNEQTYDAYTLTATPIDDVKVLYSYIDDVNRIFGPDAGLDFESDSHILHADWVAKLGDLYIGNIAAFAYFLDFGNSDANSSNTVGLRYSASRGVAEGLSVSYSGSFAHQRDAADNPIDYEANYYAIEASVTSKGVATVGGGYEVLESDDRNGGRFRTPLATLHAFNGWADQFLVTPVAGLEDVYAFVAVDLPFGIKSKVVYHWFYSEEGSSDYGEEFDIVVSKAFTKHVSVLGKMALYDGRKGSSLATAAQASNLQRYWMQAEIKF